VKWKDKNIAIGDLSLDAQNPRIQIAHGSSQDVIAEYLFETEDVIELCRSINSTGGLFPNERLIVVAHGSKYVVLEGNRRLCASRAIIAPSKVPANFKRHIPQADQATIASLATIACTVAPSRDEADPIIAKLHSFTSRKSWKPIAKMRYAWNLFKRHANLDTIANDIGERSSNVKKMIRRYAIYRRILGLPWTEKELGVLQTDTIKITPVTRVFELDAARQEIGDVFGENGDYCGVHDEDDFDAALKQIATDFMLPAQGDTKPKENTRTDVGAYLRAATPQLVSTFSHAKTAPGGGKIIPFKGKTGTPPSSSPSTSKPRPPPPQRRFFDTLNVRIDDARSLDFCRELRVINRDSCPNATGLLIRATMESSLIWFMKKKGQWAPFKKALGKPSSGLEDLVNWAKDKSNALFTDESVRRCLERFSKEVHDLNAIAHSTSFRLDAQSMYRITDNARPVIEHIVENKENLP
jgi:hypothetical protein